MKHNAALILSAEWPISSSLVAKENDENARALVTTVATIAVRLM